MMKAALHRCFFYPVLFLFIPLFPSCTDQPNVENPRPNILWIVVEDISPYIGAYGNPEVKTPNIDRLASEGVRYTNVHTTAGVCAPSRSAIITGMYPMSIGTQHMRTLGDSKYSGVPRYSAVIPEDVKCFPEYLRLEGYYCTNNEKQDYQFEAPVTVWDVNGPTASWRNRLDGKPFFSIFNFSVTHESQLFSRLDDSLTVDPAKVTVPPILPDTKTTRIDIARLYTNIEIMDSQVGEIIDKLKEDGLYDNTIIIFYSDNGGAIPWTKREITERGTHIPFIVRFPNATNAGTTNDELVSAVDFAPTMLSLAGIKIPEYMQGQAFLGEQKSATPRKYVFAARDRMDTETDRVRSVTDGRYRYVYNYMPEKPFYQDIQYRISIPGMQEILSMKEEGTLNPVTMTWFNTKPVEELYDEVNDPWDLKNLAGDSAYREKLNELRTAFQEWTSTVGDLSEKSEQEMIRRMWNGKDRAPATELPEIQRMNNGVKITCRTTGASIGYRIINVAQPDAVRMEPEMSWDFGVMNRPELKGRDLPVKPSWNLYREGETISLHRGDTLKINAMRIGYLPAVMDFVF
ncbi:MAG TPA: sulfatase [Cyclobacteriaceae bacterium]|nr:sulfatase [Cyclobacteriaceae bacterium]